MCVWEGFHDTHTHTHTHIETNRLGACIDICAPTHPRAHTHTHFDTGTGAIWLPSLQAVVVGGLSFFRTFVTGGRELEN